MWFRQQSLTNSHLLSTDSKHGLSFDWLKCKYLQDQMDNNAPQIEKKLYGYVHCKLTHFPTKLYLWLIRFLNLKESIFWGQSQIDPCQ